MDSRYDGARAPYHGGVSLRGVQHVLLEVAAGSNTIFQATGDRYVDESRVDPKRLGGARAHLCDR